VMWRGAEFLVRLLGSVVHARGCWPRVINALSYYRPRRRWGLRSKSSTDSPHARFVDDWIGGCGAVLPAVSAAMPPSNSARAIALARHVPM